ncbi:hypothetical protein [Arthrobacter sp. Hiyo1]|uniref:hypothetical protein n=1 Tax=Arthrobacter sp. Hiyo1 TaxID=1588020 RepID=UPI00155920F2|nr:hypothetical protein [Arthrobacter sp. Hiyo1]
MIDKWKPENITVADTAALALRSIDPSGMLELGLTDVPDLIRIYRRRVKSRAKTGANVLGDHEFLSRLEEYPSQQVLNTAISVGGTMVFIWFDEEMTTVVGCVIGKDHRSQGEARTSDL